MTPTQLRNMITDMITVLERLRLIIEGSPFRKLPSQAAVTIEIAARGIQGAARMFEERDDISLLRK